MKKFTALLFAVTFGIMAAWSATVVHTVQRGESLESIARTYRTTVDAIIQANPGCESAFYVGLKLNIPEAVATAVESQATASHEASAPAPAETTSTQQQYNAEAPAAIESAGPGFEPVLMLEMGFLEKMEGVSNFNYTYGATVGVNYWIIEKSKGAFAGVRIGYNSASYNHSYSERGYSASQETDSHFIGIPVNFGFAFTNNTKKFALIPMAGFDFNISVKSTTKFRATGYNEEKKKGESGKFAVGLRFGLGLRIYEFNLVGFYTLPLNDWQKSYFGNDGYFGVGLAFGF